MPDGQSQAATAGDQPELPNSTARYEQAKAGFTRLAEIKELQAGLRKEANEIIDNMEKGAGFNRGAVSEIRKQMDLSPAAIQARETSRQELFDLLLKPKLDKAAAGQDDE